MRFYEKKRVIVFFRHYSPNIWKKNQETREKVMKCSKNITNWTKVQY